MRTSIEKYEQGEVEKLINKLSPQNKKLLEKALILFNSTAGKGKAAEHKRAWIKLAYTFDKDMSRLKCDDGLVMANLIKNSELSHAARNELRNVLKRWIRDSGFYKNWSIEFNALLKKNGALKAESEVNKEKINADTMVSPAEVKTLIQSTPDLMWKTLIQLNSILACRTGCELLPLKFKAVNFDKQTITILSGKTGRQRVIYIGEAIDMVKRWFDEYKYPNPTKEDYIFPSPTNRERSLNLENYDNFLKNLSMKVLGKPVNPYLLRHSTLKLRQKELSPQVYVKFADHSLNVASRFYNNMDSEDITNELKERVYKISKLTPEQEKDYKKKLEEMEKKLSKEFDIKLEKQKQFFEWYIQECGFEPIPKSGKLLNTE